MLTYSGSNIPVLIGVHFVGAAASKTSADHLLAEQLAGEGAESHDVGHRLGVPALREHPYGDDVLYPARRAAQALPTVSTILRSCSAIWSLSKPRSQGWAVVGVVFAVGWTIDGYWLLGLLSPL